MHNSSLLYNNVSLIDADISRILITVLLQKSEPNDSLYMVTHSPANEYRI